MPTPGSVPDALLGGFLEAIAIPAAVLLGMLAEWGWLHARASHRRRMKRQRFEELVALNAEHERLYTPRETRLQRFLEAR